MCGDVSHVICHTYVVTYLDTHMWWHACVVTCHMWFATHTWWIATQIWWLTNCYTYNFDSYLAHRHAYVVTYVWHTSMVTCYVWHTYVVTRICGDVLPYQVHWHTCVLMWHDAFTCGTTHYFSEEQVSRKICWRDAVTHGHTYMCWCTANPTWGDIFECCFKAQSSKLERLFSLKRGKRDVRALSFELSKMSPQVGLAVPHHEAHWHTYVLTWHDIFTRGTSHYFSEEQASRRIGYDAMYSHGLTHICGGVLP